MADDVVLDAQDAIEGMMAKHFSAAIPALVLTATGWAVEHGGADVMRGTLRNALAMIDEMEPMIKKAMQ